IVAESVCKLENSTAKTRAIFTGNFDSAYKADIKSTYEPPVGGMKEASSVIEAKWLAVQSRTEIRRHRDSRHAEHQHGLDEKRRVEKTVNLRSDPVTRQKSLVIVQIPIPYLSLCFHQR